MEDDIQTQASTKMTYVVPLCKFEKVLLDELDQLLKDKGWFDSSSRTYTVEEVFLKWKWGSTVASGLKDFLDGETLEKSHKGNRSSAYTDFEIYLARTGSDETTLKRAALILDANPDFITGLGSMPIDVLKVQPNEEDRVHWMTVARIYDKCLPWAEHSQLFDGGPSFEIFCLIRVFMLRWHYPENRHNVLGAFLATPAFHDCWKVRRRSIKRAATGVSSPEQQDHTPSHSDTDEISENLATGPCLEDKEELGDGDFVITRQIQSDSLPKWPKTEPTLGKDGRISSEYLIFLLRELGRQQELEHPWDYVHFIPWKELEPIALSHLNTLGITMEVPFEAPSDEDFWVLWRPPSHSFLWNHHLYTEDDVYEYALQGWPFPDHYCDGKVVFRVREIEKTDMIKSLDEYWKFWNDCAVTQKSEDDTSLFVLETIPGQRFRARKRYQDGHSALSYFRNLVEAHASDNLDNLGVREIMGLEASYRSAFQHSLRLIPADELRNISWQSPVGQGANGVVYSASWNKPGGVLTTSAPSTSPVVLKDVISRSDIGRESRKKLIKELDATFASLGGSATACVQFLGVAFLSCPSRHPTETPPEPRLFLVFERATQGSLSEFLPMWYQSMDFITSWNETVSALGSIGTGICTLHSHQVLHRDLHLNNILVTDRYYPHDPGCPHEYAFMITDIGEGKILREGKEFADVSDHLASYGAVDFRAPEVQGSDGWTPKAEVFSFGVIACKMFRIRQYACTAAPPACVVERLQANCQRGGRETASAGLPLVPAMVQKIIEPCLSYSPDARPSMREVVRQLDDFSLQFVFDEDDGHAEAQLDVDWTYWAWDESLRLGRHPQKFESRTEQSDTDDPFQERPKLSFD